MDNKIMYVIKRDNLVIKDIIKKAAISKTHFYDVVNGRAVPSIEKAKKIAIALNVSVDYLFI